MGFGTARVGFVFWGDVLCLALLHLITMIGLSLG